MPAPASPRRGATTPPSYVDLNPILAAIADQPETSDYTSVQDRIRARQAQHHAAALLAQPDAADLTPTLRHAAETARAAGPEAGVWVAPIERASAGNTPVIIDLDDYLTLVDETDASSAAKSAEPFPPTSRPFSIGSTSTLTLGSIVGFIENPNRPHSRSTPAPRQPFSQRPTGRRDRVGRARKMADRAAFDRPANAEIRPHRPGYLRSGKYYRRSTQKERMRCMSRLGLSQPSQTYSKVAKRSLGECRASSAHGQ